jgi:hypothetical protein
VPPLFAASISDQLPFVDYLVGKHQNFPVVKASNAHCSILPTETDVEQIGRCCLCFYGNSGVQKYGLKCWILEFPAKAYPSQIAIMEKVINFSFLRWSLPFSSNYI